MASCDGIGTKKCCLVVIRPEWFRDHSAKTQVSSVGCMSDFEEGQLGRHDVVP